jgi:hypothetical protein
MINRDNRGVLKVPWQMVVLMFVIMMLLYYLNGKL